MIETTMISIKVPKGIEPYLMQDDLQGEFERNALIVYGLIEFGRISHGKAAEILGVRKWDLIEYYNSIGMPYLRQSKEDLLAELDVYDRIPHWKS
ncbi:MAG: UPF0175 family protein [Lachnospiraceae bacterium]|nr:UPF0175 family protein [Lachnospiraceae bacterium]